MHTAIFSFVAAAALALPSTASAATIFSNDFSFYDIASKTVVKGTISGLTDGTNVSASGLSIQVTQSPFSTLGTFTGGTGKYTAKNGVFQSSPFFTLSDSKNYISFFTTQQGVTLAEIGTPSRFANASNDGVSFVGAATSAVPEPATWAMMLLGFGAIGGAMRRRQTTARVRFA